MRWQDRQRSSNVEDRRGSSGSGSSGGGGFRFPLGSGRGGLGLIAVLVLVLLFGGKNLLGGLLGGFWGGNIDLGDILGDVNLSDVVLPQAEVLVEPENATVQTGSLGGELNVYDEDELLDFLSVVLRETELAWEALFQAYGRQYRAPSLVVFSGSVQSACGAGYKETGPFYCPADQKVYMDLSFFQELAEQYGAAGDFAAAYVLAHEVGHHVQYLLGITQQIEQQRGQISQTDMNRLTVRLELQADYLAGVWAHYAARESLLEPGDLEEAMRATAAIGDDRLQRQGQGYVVPDSFTHGTSAQRSAWFWKGYETGSLEEWDTFSIPYGDLLDETRFQRL